MTTSPQRHLLRKRFSLAAKVPTDAADTPPAVTVTVGGKWAGVVLEALGKQLDYARRNDLQDATAELETIISTLS